MVSVARDRLGGEPISFDEIRVGDEIATDWGGTLAAVGVVTSLEHDTAFDSRRSVLASKAWQEVLLIHRPEPTGAAFEPRDVEEAREVRQSIQIADEGEGTGSWKAEARTLANEIRRLRDELKRVSELGISERAAAQVAVEALREAANDLKFATYNGPHPELMTRAWLRKRADEIERGER